MPYVIVTLAVPTRVTPFPTPKSTGDCKLQFPACTYITVLLPSVKEIAALVKTSYTTTDFPATPEISAPAAVAFTTFEAFGRPVSLKYDIFYLGILMASN